MTSAGLAIALAFASSAAAQTTYQINRTIGQGTVTGTIETDGKSGVLSASDILAWNLKLTGANGVTTTLTNIGAQSANQFIGSDVSVSGNKLQFNFSAADGGYFAFQANPGQYSGNKYWCNSAGPSACAAGDSVVPGAYTDASAQYMAESGLQTLGLSGPMQTSAEFLASLVQLVASRRMEMITSNLLSSQLLGSNEQVSCGNCGGADATFGSFNISAHGRHSITPSITVLGGVSIGQYNERGADVRLSVTAAGAIRFDPANMGASRPFVEIGGSATPRQSTTYSRSYTYNAEAEDGSNSGSTRSSIYNLYGRVGWVARVTPRDELAGSITVAHTWQMVDAYSEGASETNPFAIQYGGGTDQMTVVSVGGQYTRLLTRQLEIGVSAGVQQSVDSKSGIRYAVSDGIPGPPSAGEQIWASYGARVGIRFTQRLVADLYVDGVSGGAQIGTTLHGGFGFRLLL